MISRVHANQKITEVFARKIICDREQVSVSGHESDCRPTVAIVANVDVGSLGIVAADRNEISVEEREIFIIRECLLVHALAKAAPECGEKKHHWLVLVAS